MLYSELYVNMENSDLKKHHMNKVIKCDHLCTKPDHQSFQK